MTRLCALLLRTACIVLVLTTAVAAQACPTNPESILGPFSTRVNNENVARLLATQLSERLR